MDENDILLVREAIQMGWKYGIQRAIQVAKRIGSDEIVQKLQAILDNEECPDSPEPSVVFGLMRQIKELQNGKREST